MKCNFCESGPMVAWVQQGNVMRAICERCRFLANREALTNRVREAAWEVVFAFPTLTPDEVYEEGSAGEKIQRMMFLLSELDSLEAGVLGEE